MTFSETSDLAVIVVNWERPHDTIACIESVRLAMGDLSSVILIDNGSKDRSPEILQKQFPGIRLLVLLSNRGFSGGTNVGIQAALEGGATNLFLLNNDALVHPDTITTLLNVKADISVPKILYHPEKDRLWAAGAYWRKTSGTIKMRGNGKIDRGQYERPSELEYATACALMVHRAVFETIGTFDESFINYYEDYDFCYRARQAGFSIRYEPLALAYHKDATSLDRSPHQRWWFIARNTVHFFDKHEYFTLRILLRNMLWVALRELILMRFSRLFHYLKGYRDGLQEIRKVRSL